MNVDTQQIIKSMAGGVMPDGFAELPKELQADAKRLIDWADNRREAKLRKRRHELAHQMRQCDLVRRSRNLNRRR